MSRRLLQCVVAAAIAATLCLTANANTALRTFSLVNQAGKPTSERDLRGKPALVFFGYTSCPDVCPTELVEIAAAVRTLDQAGVQVTPVFITVDPARDTTQVLAGYVSAFHPRLMGLTGSKQQVASVMAAFSVESGSKTTGSTTYVWHTSNIYLLDADGRLVETFAPYTKASVIATRTTARVGGPSKKVKSP